MKKKIIRSYAKVNLSLKVLSKNKNNFHNIQSVISFLDFHDLIYIKPTNANKHIVQFKGPFT